MSDHTSTPGETYWRALEPFCDSVSIYDGPAVFQQQFSTIPSHIGVLLAAHWLDSEVNNGGFEQLFFNSTGVLVPEARAAFEALNLRDAAAVIEEAMSVFGPDYPRDRAQRVTMLEALLAASRRQSNPFTALDDRYYDLVPSERFESAADSYASRNVA